MESPRKKAKKEIRYEELPPTKGFTRIRCSNYDCANPNAYFVRLSGIGTIYECTVCKTRWRT